MILKFGNYIHLPPLNLFTQKRFWHNHSHILLEIYSVPKNSEAHSEIIRTTRDKSPRGSSLPRITRCLGALFVPLTKFQASSQISFIAYISLATYQKDNQLFSCIKAQGRFMRVLIRVWIFSYFPLFYVQVWISWIPAKVLGLQSNWYSVEICASNTLCVQAGSSETEKGQRPCEANRFSGIHTRSISIMQKPMVRFMSKIWSAQNYYITGISPDIFKSLTLTTTST